MGLNQLNEFEEKLLSLAPCRISSSLSPNPEQDDGADVSQVPTCA